MNHPARAMFRRHRPPRSLIALLALAPAAMHAHEEWNNLHITYSARAAYTYPFDGRTPKIAAVLLNHYDTLAPATVFSFTVNGRPPATGVFPSFPNGGNIVADPQNFGFASVLTAGVYDGRTIPAPTIGETKDYVFQFVFALAPGAVAPAPAGTGPSNPDPDNNGDPPGTTTAVVRFTNLGDNPLLAGPLGISGTLRLPIGPTATGVRIEVATPFSNWFPITFTAAAAGNGSAYSFSQALPARDDWHVRFSATGFESRLLPVGYVNDPHPPMDLALSPSLAPEIDYRRAAAIATPTGFWRGAVSESEGTFVVFPGQENWRAAATETEARALRTASRITKYKFDGTRLWEHAPGWETWAGDMTPDGRFVAYAPNPTVLPFYTPAENKLVLLDGATGAVIWTKSAAPADAAIGRKLDSLEIAFSPDARWIAVGSVGTGAVTLVERATGVFAWTVPGAGTTSFGQVRKLRFSADSQFLFCGSGDSSLRKLRVTDGAVRWKIFAGGWPSVSGLDLTPDGTWLVAGTKSLDATMVRASDGFQQWQRETQYPDAVFAPDGRHLVTAGGQVFRTLDASLAGMTKTDALARFTPDSRAIVQFDRELKLYDLGGKVLRTFEASGIATAAGEPPQWAYLTRDARYAIILARDMANPLQTGIAIYERRAAVATTGAPVITAQPLAQTVATSGAATLSVTANGAAPLSFQWRKNGADLATAAASAGPTFALVNASAADAGVYTCVVSNAAGTITSAPALVDVAAADTANPSRLTNLAVRANVGAAPLIVGFSVGGAGTSGPKLLLIRGAGPSLTALGVTDALADPRLGLFSGTTSVLANDNWGGDAQIAALAGQLGAFPFAAATSRDAALAAIAVGGSYTAQLASADATGGTALAEIYDGSSSYSATTPRLVNVSARTDVGGASLLIAGFVIAGPTAKTVLIRGIGPSLASFGIRTALADPQLTLFRDGTLVAENDNWYDASNAVAIVTTAAQVGAFGLAPVSRDAALLLSLPPGNYTAQVSDTAGRGGTGGTALVEVYEVP
ncbi:MAG: hypothetical protein EXS37_16135 [Opitutus sp.]|nr:hypothetical protein [Opitutus sp.]